MIVLQPMKSSMPFWIFSRHMSGEAIISPFRKDYVDICRMDQAVCIQAKAASGYAATVLPDFTKAEPAWSRT
jgi:hypothetical protein